MKTSLFASIVCFALLSCHKDDVHPPTITPCVDHDMPHARKANPNVFYSCSVTMGEGKVYNWISFTKKNKPESIGVVFENKVFETVPPGPDATLMLHVPFHEKANSTLFRFTMLGWNPVGHPPTDIYTVPHFDVHFYMEDEATVMEYMDPDLLAQELPEGYYPEDHIGVDPIPMMGLHWVDTNSPELNGVKFTQTFIYGSFAGKMVFLEPMFTLEWIKTVTSFTRDLPLPAKVQRSGYYPTKMTIVRSENETRVALTDFIYREAS